MFLKLCQGFFKTVKWGAVDIPFRGTYNRPMEKNMQDALASSVRGFRMPRYGELPDVGLYLEQTTKYVNYVFRPLAGVEITGSMIRNYVKMGLASNPVKKQYGANQIAHLLCVTLLKQGMPLDHISQLFARQKAVYADAVAYDYFCTELENILYFRFGLKDTVDSVGVTSSVEKEMLRSAIVAVSHIIYLNACFEHLKNEEG